jgi:hypothetical protein
MMRSNVLTIGAGAACAFPMQSYRPADCTPEQHLAVREGLYRAARRDGLGDEAAEEAAAAFYLHWITRDYGGTTIPRGDHLRAFYSARALARRTNWKGRTGSRRAASRKKTAEMVAWRERRRAAMVPQPWQAVAEADKLSDQPWTKTARAVADQAAAAGMAPAAFVAAAYGVEADRPRYAGHPAAPAPAPWTADQHAAILNRKPASGDGWQQVEPGHYVRLRG